MRRIRGENGDKREEQPGNSKIKVMERERKGRIIPKAGEIAYVKIRKKMEEGQVILEEIFSSEVHKSAKGEVDKGGRTERFLT